MAARVGPKTKSFPPAAPQIGQNAKSLDELLQAIKDEYVYNTKVRAVSAELMPESTTLGT